eukprot:4663274-Pyramimonas_sp.AAC.1
MAARVFSICSSRRCVRCARTCTWRAATQQPTRVRACGHAQASSCGQRICDVVQNWSKRGLVQTVDMREVRSCAQAHTSRMKMRCMPSQLRDADMIV